MKRLFAALLACGLLLLFLGCDVPFPGTHKPSISMPPETDDPLVTLPPTGDAPTDPPPEDAADGSNLAHLNDSEREMLALVNDARAGEGLAPLTEHPELSRLARLKAQDMVDLGYFSHDSPTYGSPADMVRGAGIAYRALGENIAKASTVDQAFTALMESEGHRNNILGSAYTHLGVGVVEYGDAAWSQKRVVVVQLFIRRESTST